MGCSISFLQWSGGVTQVSCGRQRQVKESAQDCVASPLSHSGNGEAHIFQTFHWWQGTVSDKQIGEQRSLKTNNANMAFNMMIGEARQQKRAELIMCEVFISECHVYIMHFLKVK